jgi:periplasmic glucans biosynthesis protein
MSFPVIKNMLQDSIKSEIQVKKICLCKFKIAYSLARMFRMIDKKWGLGVLALVLGPLQVSAQVINREKVDFAVIEELAQAASKTPYKRPSESRPIPGDLEKLTYNDYRKIQFQKDKAPWKADNLNFQLHFFHPGYIYKDTVILHEYTNSHVQQIRFMNNLFDYADSGVSGDKLPEKLGYAGFRLLFPLNDPQNYDEVAVFQGASYYRLLAAGQQYGLSARGLALNSGRTDVAEEFPIFTKFWIGKPTGKDNNVHLYALLESESVTGAYEFDIRPGAETVAEIRATLYFRVLPKSIGLAPLTSMFWFGENTKHKPDDFRPEVHDSDGLAIKTGSGECIWRPASMDPGRIHFNSFAMDGVKGFGLLQRDREIANYQDAEANYHRRPGVWIEPKEGFGAGTVVLVELPTGDETSDNLVAYWEPRQPPVVKEPYRFSYKQTWSNQANPVAAGAITHSTRTGLLPWRPGERMVLVDFQGKSLEALTAATPPEAVVEVVSPHVAEVADATVHYVEALKRWRLTFFLRPPGFAASEGQRGLVAPTLVESAEIRAFLKKGDDILTESWTYRIDP